MDNRVLAGKNEVKRAIIGKDDVIDKVMTAIIAGGHILLEDIPGVGPKRRAMLLDEFGSIDAIKKASHDDLMKLDGMTSAVADNIIEFFRT